MTFDAIDVKILEILQENARVSISELSKCVNLSISAVSERLKKLEGSRVIEQYTAILSEPAMNKNLSALILISLDSPNQTEEFLKLVSECDEILSCYSITGEYDYSLFAATEDTASLEILMNKIKSIHNVKRTQTNVVLSKTKVRHSVKPVANR